MTLEQFCASKKCDQLHYYKADKCFSCKWILLFCAKDSQYNREFVINDAVWKRLTCPLQYDKRHRIKKPVHGPCLYIEELKVWKDLIEL